MFLGNSWIMKEQNFNNDFVIKKKEAADLYEQSVDQPNCTAVVVSIKVKIKQDGVDQFDIIDASEHGEIFDAFDGDTYRRNKHYWEPKINRTS